MIWSEALNLGELFLFSILVALSLFLTGYSFQRKLPWLNDTNYIEKIIVGMLLGMIMLVIISSFASIVGSFIYIVFIALPLTGTIFLLWDNRNARKLNLKISWKKLVENIPFALLLILVSFLSFNAVTFFVGSTNADAAYHTFFISTILTNGRVIDKALPFYNYLLYAPSGPHIIGSFVVYLMSYPIEKVVVSLSSFYTVATLVGIYALCRGIFKSNVIGILGGILALFAWKFWHPLSFTFTIPIMTFSLCTGILILIRTLDAKIGKWKKIFVMSFFLAFSLFIHPALLIYSIAFIIPYFAINRLGLLRNKRQVATYLAGCFLVVCSILFLASPYLATVFEYSRNSTVGLPSDWILPVLRSTYAPPTVPSYSLNMFVNIFTISNYAALQGALLYIGPLSILFVLMFLVIWFVIPSSRKKINSSVSSRWILLTKMTTIFFLQFELVYVFSNISYSTYFPPVFGGNPLSYVTDPLRAIEMLYLPLIILSCATISYLMALPSLILNRELSLRHPFKRKIDL